MELITTIESLMLNLATCFFGNVLDMLRRSMDNIIAKTITFSHYLAFCLAYRQIHFFDFPIIYLQHKGQC